MFQRVPDTSKIDLIYGYGSGPDVLSSWYVRNTAVDHDESYESDLCDAAENWWNAEVKPLQTSAITLREIRATDLDTQYGVRFAKTVGSVGTGAATPAPAVIAGIVHLNGSSGAAPRKGTMFHPGITEGQVAADSLDAGFATSLAAAYTAFLTESSLNIGDVIRIVSRYEGFTLETRPNGTVRKKPTPRTPALTNGISSVTVPQRVGVQKRRRPSPL